MNLSQADLKPEPPSKSPKLSLESVAALAVTLFSAILLLLTAAYAGPLWRDEVNTINVAQMPSLQELWNNMQFESFPPLWPLILRALGFLGLIGSDASIRILGLFIGWFFLVSLWLCSRWMGRRAPSLSIALLGSLPAFIFIIGANRAYGLASCLLVLSFGMIWRLVESPSRLRFVQTGLVCFLFAHCVYYDVIFLFAMLSGGALVVIRRREWKTLAALVVIGAVSAGTMAIYLPIIHRGSAFVPMIQFPYFSFSFLWNRLGTALAASSSAQNGYNWPEVWFWIALLWGGVLTALLLQRQYQRQKSSPEAAVVANLRARADLALFCAVSVVVGVLGYLAFLLRLHYPTQTWYYVEMLCLCAISLDGLLGANWPALRPWGLLRIGLMIGLMTWFARSGWEEAHTQRSNIDLIAAVFDKKAAEGDLIVVQSAWEGITFNRYYHGRTHWMTVPPIDSHLVHRNDLVLEKMNQPDSINSVLSEIATTLHGSNSVWLVGNMQRISPKPSPTSGLPMAWFGTHMNYWSGQVTAQLLGHAQYIQNIEISVGQPVCQLENLPVVRFSGYKD